MQATCANKIITKCQTAQERCTIKNKKVTKLSSNLKKQKQNNKFKKKQNIAKIFCPQNKKIKRNGSEKEVSRTF